MRHPGTLALVAGSLTITIAACESSPSPSPPATEQTQPLTIVDEPPPPPAPAPKHPLHSRAALNLDTIRESRPKLLAGITKARSQRKKADALRSLESLRELDPTGAGLAIEALRVAENAGEREKWARVAVAFAHGDEALIGRARAAWGKGGDSLPLAAPTAKVPEQKELSAACGAVVRELTEGRVPLRIAAAKVSDARCEHDYELETKAPALVRAVSLRVQASAEGELALGFVALESPKGVSVYGPVASAWSPKRTGATNDFVIDLQQVDVLPGGAPEVVVRITELITTPDVARNEVTEIDQVRVLLLTLDRGVPQSSKELLLSRRAVTKTIDPNDKLLPAGWPRSRGLDEPRAFEMKVEWGGPNEIRLSRASGSEEPPASGTIPLFP